MGTHERYTEARDELETAFLDKFQEEWVGRGAFRTNPPAASQPHTFLPPDKAECFVGRFSPMVHLGVRKAVAVVSCSH